jgi:penicillin-binding protein 1A
MRYLYFFCIGFFLISCAVTGAAFFLFTSTWIDVSVLEHYDPGRPSIVLDDEGNEWTRFALDRREPVPITQLPSHLVEAFLSAEDWNFFSHYGISVRGIIRSLLVNLYYGRKLQGASTITQQLVKLLFFDLNKTFSRKLKEQIYALVIEQQFTKQQILEIYLNHVYFGCGIYGVQAAAQRFWGISAADLSIAQSATLAGIICSPANYCPLLHPLSSEYRRNIVLGSMLKRGVISQEAYINARETPLHIVEQPQKIDGEYVKEMIRQFLEDLVGKKELYSGGLIVQITLNQKMQRAAEKAFHSHMIHLKRELNEDINGALISFEVQTGEIKALVGGANFAHSSFNRATQARRQFGSVFKPMVYAAAIEQGLAFSDVVVDEPIQLQQGNKLWEPNNWNHMFNGPITRAFALSHSNNIVSIKTLLETGIYNVIDLARRCHIPGPFFPYPSLALGCIDGTLKQAAAMFNVFANDGIYVEPYCIRWVKNRWGTKIYKKDVAQERVMARAVVGKVAKVLMDGLKRIHKWFAHQWFQSEAISKTGTTNDSRTCWFIGSTPKFTTAVYIGNDDNRSLGTNVYPVRTAFPIWLALTRTIAITGDRFTFDPTLQLCTINGKTGKICEPNDPEAIEIFV